MDWQLPDIAQTITNNLVSSSLSAYAVRIRSTSELMENWIHFHF